MKEYIKQTSIGQIYVIGYIHSFMIHIACNLGYLELPPAPSVYPIPSPGPEIHTFLKKKFVGSREWIQCIFRIIQEMTEISKILPPVQSLDPKM